MQRLQIEGEMTIFTAAQQKDALLAFLESDDELEIDLSQVGELDTAGLQLLILIKRDAAQAGKTLRFALHSHAVLNVLELANLGAAFGDQVVLTRPD